MQYAIRLADAAGRHSLVNASVVVTVVRNTAPEFVSLPYESTIKANMNSSFAFFTPTVRNRDIDVSTDLAVVMVMVVNGFYVYHMYVVSVCLFECEDFCLSF